MTEPTYDDMLTNEQINSALADTELNANDRCDRCKAQAYVLLSVAGMDMHLMFCAHHFDKLKDSIETGKLVMVRDDRAKLLERNEPAFTGV